MVSIVESGSVVICDRSGCCPDSRNNKHSAGISGTETKCRGAGGEERHSRNGNHGTDGGRDRDGVQRVEALRGGDGDSGIGARARAVAEGVRRIA